MDDQQFAAGSPPNTGRRQQGQRGLEQVLSATIIPDVAAESAFGTNADTVIPAQARKRQASETRRLYATDWADFAAWGRARQLGVLPAQPGTVAAYLTSLAATLSYGALARRAAAIADRHRRDILPLPTSHGVVRVVLRAARAAGHSDLQTSKRGLKRSSTRRLPPPGPVLLLRMAARCPSDLAGLRDRALLLLTAAGFGGERLLALDREHVHFTAHGMVLAVPAAHADGGRVVDLLPATVPNAWQAATVGEALPVPQAVSAIIDAPFVIARRAGAAACPVRALERWLEHSETRFGPVFRKVNRWNGIEHARLRPDALRRIWQRRIAALRETSTQRRTQRSANAAG